MRYPLYVQLRPRCSLRASVHRTDLRSGWSLTSHITWSASTSTFVDHLTRQTQHTPAAALASAAVESTLASPSAIAPLPVPRSAQRPPHSCGLAATATSTRSSSCSVSGRGMSTPAWAESMPTGQARASTSHLRQHGSIVETLSTPCMAYLGRQPAGSATNAHSLSGTAAGIYPVAAPSTAPAGDTSVTGAWCCKPCSRPQGLNYITSGVLQVLAR